MKDCYLSYTLDILRELIHIPSPSGYTHQAADFLMRELRALGYHPRQTNKGGVVADLGGPEGNAPADSENNGALLLCCHLDTLGAMVAEVKENGRLRVSPIGMVSPNNIESENVRIHTRTGREYEGTFQLINPSYHVNHDLDTTRRNFDNMEVVIDEHTNTREETRILGIDNGDFISFAPRFTITESGYIKSRHLDDKLSCAILLAYAKYLKEEQAAPDRHVYLHFTVHEEVGHGASAFCPADVTEVLAVDMGCVGPGLSCDERKVSICAADVDGPTDYRMTTRLIELAKKDRLSYAVDVYPIYGSDADALQKAGRDIRHAVVGAGVYASHGYERSHVEGLINTYELVRAYIGSSRVI